MRKIAMAGAAIFLVGSLIGSPAPIGATPETSGPADVEPANHGWCTRAVLYSRPPGYVHIPATSSNNEHCLMNRGSRGVAPEVLQHTLNECYLRPNRRTLLEVDGVFGEKTEAALKYAQGKEGIGADGVYGPQTRGKLKWAYFHQPACYGRIPVPW